jgi:hypothetical protein
MLIQKLFALLPHAGKKLYLTHTHHPSSAQPELVSHPSKVKNVVIESCA